MRPFALPEIWQLTNYVNAVQISSLPRLFLNSVIVSSLSTILTLVVTSMAAFVFDGLDSFQEVDMTKKIQWGLLATGGIAHAFARGLAMSKTGELAAVGSRSREKADAFAAEFGGPGSCAGVSTT